MNSPNPPQEDEALDSVQDNAGDNDEALEQKIDEVLLQYRNYLYDDDREILGGMLSAKDTKASLLTILRERERLRAIEELELVKHHPESKNAPRWTYENVKDRIEQLQKEGKHE